MAPLLARSVLVLAALTLAPAARGGECRPVHGFYTSVIQGQEPLTTAGQLVGGLQGTYAFVQTGLAPAAALTQDPALAGALFYVGTSDVTLKGGDHVFASDAGVLELARTGKQAALLVVTGGTGGHEGASGFLQLRGGLDPATGQVSGDYDGELCAP